MVRWWLCGLLIIWLWLVPLGNAPGWASPPPELEPLTLPTLQARLRSPIQRDGVRTLDLRRLEIDLRPENQPFRQEFFRLIQSQTNSQTPLGLDLSYSHILGNWSINDLGLQAPLYGQSLSGLFSDRAQTQLQRDRRRLLQLSKLSRSLLTPQQPTPLQLTVIRGPLTLTQTRFEGFANFSNTFFVDRVDAQGVIFTQDVDWSESRFSQPVNLIGCIFQQGSVFRNTIFFEKARFNQVQFRGQVDFISSEFQGTATFGQATFQQQALFERVTWRGSADLAQTIWKAPTAFDQSTFMESLFLTEADFEQSVSFRRVQFTRPVNLRGAKVQVQADFGDTTFSPGAYLNVAGMQFNAEKASIIGNPGQLGKVLSVPILAGNETLLRNLVRNFRLQEQIPDANQLEYTREKLRSRQLWQQLTGTNLNTALADDLQRIGFSATQAESIAQFRQEQPFRSITDLLKVESVDLATYVKVRDRVVAQESRTLLGWLADAWYWLGLVLLLALSRYGTEFWLAMGVGLVAIGYFSILFWIVDRVRRFHPNPILPPLVEAGWVVGGSGSLMLIGTIAIFRTADLPWLTLTCLGIATLPVPLVLLSVIYKQGRYHNLMDVSYFVEDGGMRQFRLLLGRLPNIPKFAFFRDRFTPIPWNRRWNWLNYLDFSLNNLLKFGFNDIRLRDEYLPGLVNALAWYQWGLGMLYFTLLLWTLSRTIPGLNLLIYFK
jgi:hypothetical protein